ncbi:MAG: hypothetical protein ACI8RZ_003567 [Myxococcota bacterium]|jgi:hypothetical protein
MQEKQGRMLTWMAGSLVVLVGVVVLGDREETPPDADEETWTSAFGEVERSAVTSLTITGTGAPLTLDRVDDSWRISAPIQATADGDRIRGLLGSLEDLECGDDLEASSAAAFGLEPPAWTLSLTADGAEHRLRIGKAAPVGGRTYVQCADDAVRTTRQSILDSLTDRPDDFRSRAVARFPISALTELRVTLPVLTPGLPIEDPTSATLTAQRTAAGWRDAETGALLDAEKIQVMAEAMLDATVDSFDTEPPTPPLIRFEAVADGETHTLEYGINGTARVPLQDAAVTLSGEFPVPGQLDTLLASVLLDVDPITLSELSVRLGGQSVSAIRDNNGWTQPTAEALLAALLEVRVNRRQTAPAAEGEPWGSVTLVDAEGQSREVMLHQDVEGQRVVADPAGGPTFLLPATELDRLRTALGG